MQSGTAIVGVEFAAFVQQGGGTVLNPLHRDAETRLVAVHIPIIQAVNFVFLQRLERRRSEVHHKLFHHRASFLHIAAGGLVGLRIVNKTAKY
jgi:hypothetical protein